MYHANLTDSCCFLLTLTLTRIQRSVPDDPLLPSVPSDPRVPVYFIYSTCTLYILEVP